MRHDAAPDAPDAPETLGAVPDHPLSAVLAGRRLVLASGSPRRRELLTAFGVPFEVVAPDVDETPRPDEQPADLVARLAVAKAEAVAGPSTGAIVVAADTVVALDGRILGKPADAAEAAAMLRALSGRVHVVLTGVAVAVEGAAAAVGVERSAVEFAMLSDELIAWYVGTGEPLDKAGAYGMQGRGGVLVRSITGSASNVVGLPLARLAELVDEAASR